MEKKEKEKKTSYVPKERKRESKKEYEVILVKPNSLVLSLNGNGYEIPIGKYTDKKIGDKIML